MVSRRAGRLFQSWNVPLGSGVSSGRIRRRGGARSAAGFFRCRAAESKRVVGYEPASHPAHRLLISGQIDNNASVRRLLVSAILTGGNRMVGANGTGPVSEIGARRSASQTGTRGWGQRPNGPVGLSPL